MELAATEGYFNRLLVLITIVNSYRKSRQTNRLHGRRHEITGETNRVVVGTVLKLHEVTSEPRLAHKITILVWSRTKKNIA
jgi:hypothetical protein